MTLEAQHQRFGPPGMQFDYSSSSSHAAPQFTNPWTSSPSSQPGLPLPSVTSAAGPGLFLANNHHQSHQGHLHSMVQSLGKPLLHPQQSPAQALPPSLPPLTHPLPPPIQSLHHLPSLTQPPPHRSSTAGNSTSLASYASMPVSAATVSPAESSLLAQSHPHPHPHTHEHQQSHHDLVGMSHDVLSLNGMNRFPRPPGFAEFSATAASPVNSTFAPANAPSFDTMDGYPASSMRSIVDDRKSFAEALDASHGMLAMSQETPRGNAYPGRAYREASDSYGFPSSGTHSNSSSISSQAGGNFNAYYADSLSEYSTAGSDIESVASRGLGPSRVSTSNSLMSGVPPAPQSMMGQFSSKVSTATQKKHKCKICDKRFTRPSSLQTHMYSHTGEKPFACEVEGCGRQFSVVSNLRRHRKVHKDDNKSEAGSEERDQQSD